jgi:hypothetical protein
MKSFFYRLLFTRSDDLDLLQVMFLSCITFFFVSFSLDARNVWDVSDRAWETFDLVFIVLAVVGTPKWLAEILSSLLTHRLARTQTLLNRGWSPEDPTTHTPSPKGEDYDGQNPVIE